MNFSVFASFMIFVVFLVWLQYEIKKHNRYDEKKQKEGTKRKVERGETENSGGVGRGCAVRRQDFFAVCTKIDAL